MRALFCILVVAAVYFCAVGFLHTADEVRAEQKAHPNRIVSTR